MHHRFMLRAALALFTSSIAGTATAATITWNTAGAGDLTAANYVDATSGLPVPAPTAADVLYIGKAGTATYQTSTNNSYLRLEVGHSLSSNPGDGTVIMNGGTLSLTAGGGVVGNSSVYIGQGTNGTLQLNGGTVISARGFVVGYGNDTSKLATFNVGTGAFFRIGNGNGAIYIGSGPASTVGTPGQMTFSGNAYNPGDVTVGDIAGSSYTQNFGSFTIAGSMTVGRSTSGSSTATFSGGTFTVSSFNLSAAATNQANFVDIGGSAYVQTGTGNFSVGNSATSIGTTFTLGGSATVNSGQYFLIGGSAATKDLAHNITVNQNSGTLITTLDVRVGDAGGWATYNLNDGTMSPTDGILVGRRGIGRMIQIGGTANAGGAGLRIGDSGTLTIRENNGQYQISGGTLNASNISLGNNGTGTLLIVGEGGKISGSGNFTANAALTGTLTPSALAFKLESGESLTEVVMSGTASFAQGTYVSLDLNGTTPIQSTYDLLTATSISLDPGTIFDNTNAPGWMLQVVSGGNGQILQATIPEPTGFAVLGVAALALQQRRRRRWSA